MVDIQEEIDKRRTFAIISHPDAGKTTITEKLLLFGDAIHMAGMVKAKKDRVHTTSDWMDIERERGISVSSSVMQFDYLGKRVNLLDTPGHNDFSEDTYRVLTAVDSALMVIDAAKGIETQTRKLFQVCRDRNIPIITFINKMDRPTRDAFELIDQIESELNLPCTAVTWPVGAGDRFKGVYDRNNHTMRFFEASKTTIDFKQQVFKDLSGDDIRKAVGGAEYIDKLQEDLELLDGVGLPFDEKDFMAGKLSPVFFGSALNNFGVQELLEFFLEHAPKPQGRSADTRVVQPDEKKFSGVVFKIQANMDPKHRDRYAFVRICSGEFKQGMNVHHVRQGRPFKVKQAMQFLSRERTNVETAYAGDIVGFHDRGTLRIGDTVTEGEQMMFTGIPQFAPDVFALVTLRNPIKNKQLLKGLEQLSEEGTSQVLKKKYNSDIILGVVGALQLEVVKHRLLTEYGADAIFTSLPFESSAWYHSADASKLDFFESYYRDQIVFDVRENPMVLCKTEWERDYMKSKHPEVQFFTSLIAYEEALRSS